MSSPVSLSTLVVVFNIVGVAIFLKFKFISFDIKACTYFANAANIRNLAITTVLIVIGVIIMALNPTPITIPTAYLDHGTGLEHIINGNKRLSITIQILQWKQATLVEPVNATLVSGLERSLLDQCLKKANNYSSFNFLYWNLMSIMANEENEYASLFLKHILIETKAKRQDHYEELMRQKWLISEIIELGYFVANFSGKSFNKKIKQYYKIIFKNVDDLRRDQMMTNMIYFMDTLLNDINVYLTPYPVLVTGVNHGLMEFIPNAPTVDNILSKYNNNISMYFESMAEGKRDVFSVLQDRFVRSLSVYCVITYLFGVGDRHLDNILLTNEVFLVHIDFGYIYGEEPTMKSLISPKIRVIRQMIAVMDGYDSQKYKEFQKLMTLVYCRLREMAPLILDVISMMDPHNAQFIKYRLHLDINEDLAVNKLLQIVDKAVNATFWSTMFIDMPHRFRTKYQ